MTDKIREQIKRATIFAALCDEKPTHHLCGTKVTDLVSTMEKLLAVSEHAQWMLNGAGEEAVYRLRKALAELHKEQ